MQGDPGGATGATGLQGVTGLQGLKGDPGPQGVKGDPGPTGTEGIIGQVVVTVLDETHLSRRTVDAKCPTGKVVLGGGYAFFGEIEADEPITVTDSLPIVDGTGWRVVARGPSGGWSLYAYAVCADEG